MRGGHTPRDLCGLLPWVGAGPAAQPWPPCPRRLTAYRVTAGLKDWEKRLVISDRAHLGKHTRAGRRAGTTYLPWEQPSLSGPPPRHAEPT